MSAPTNIFTRTYISTLSLQGFKMDAFHKQRGCFRGMASVLCLLHNSVCEALLGSMQEIRPSRCPTHTFTDCQQKSEVTNIGQVVFSDTVANCVTLRVVRRHLGVRRTKETACIFQNVTNVPLIFINSKCVNLLTAGSKGKFLYFYVV
jgi:hypothetical protein